MDIGAVESVRPLERVGARRGPGDLAPALGVEGAVRMEEDSYRESGKDQDRGMEEDAEGVEEGACGPETNATSGKKGGVNCFA
jgi:hypothetical protein